MYKEKKRKINILEDEYNLTKWKKLEKTYFLPEPCYTLEVYGIKKGLDSIKGFIKSIETELKAKRFN